MKHSVQLNPILLWLLTMVTHAKQTTTIQKGFRKLRSVQRFVGKIGAELKTTSGQECVLRLVQ